MNDHEKSELEQHLTSRNTWLRLIYMLLFAFIFWIAIPVLAVVVILQFLNVLVTGKGNQNLVQFGSQLGKYFQQVIYFLCYRDEDHPFPFGDWPDGNSNPAKSSPSAKPRKKTTRKKAGK